MSRHHIKKRDEVQSEPVPVSFLNDEQRAQLRAELQAIPQRVRREFAAAFEAWKETWTQGGILVSSDPHASAFGPEYDRLVALGPQILALVVSELADPAQFLALQLYDALQADDNLVIQFPADDPRILEGEQGRARRVVQAWLGR